MVIIDLDEFDLYFSIIENVKLILNFLSLLRFQDFVNMDTIEEVFEYLPNCID
jgi:hypothetical protein